MLSRVAATRVALCLSLALFDGWSTGVAAATEPNWPSVEARALAFLQEYLQVRSVNPPADTREAASLLKRELETHGFHPTLYESGPTGQTTLVVRLKGRDASRKPLLLLNHMDVVPVDEKAWPLDPFGGIVRDGQIWGRGALDMKGLGVQQLMALIALSQAGHVPSRDIVVMATADEESGGARGVQWMIANHFDEIDAEYVLDEGGLGSRDTFATYKLVFGI